MMSAFDLIHKFELDWIVALQGGGHLKKLMLQCSYLGSEAFAYVLPLVYFCVSRSAGSRLYLLYAFSGTLVYLFKLAFLAPRPFWIDDRIKELSGSGGYGMPSGHVLAATVVWGFIAKILKRPWVWLLAITFVLLVSFSRVYLGVHFITDVAAAWLIGAGLLWCFDPLERRLMNRLNGFTLSWQIGIAMWTTAILVCVGIGVRLAIDGIVDDPSWSRHSNGTRSLEGLYSSTGEFFGAACGVILTRRWACFEVCGRLWKRALAVGYAVLGVWLMKQCFEPMPSPQTDVLRSLCNFVHGAVPNLWLLFLSPWVLLKTGLIHAPVSTHGLIERSRTVL